MPLDHLMTAIVAGDVAAVQSLVAEHPHLVHGHDPRGVPLLLVSCYYRQTEITAILLEGRRTLGVPLDVHEAAALGDPDELLAALAVAPMGHRTWSADGYTALHLAAFFGRPENVRVLLTAGADPCVTARNVSHVQPLHSAAAARQLEIARMLVHAGAELDARQQGGWTPLHAAAAHGDEPLVRLLLAAGAAPMITNEDGRTPAALAREHGHEDVAILIEGSVPLSGS